LPKIPVKRKKNEPEFYEKIWFPETIDNLDIINRKHMALNTNNAVKWSRLKKTKQMDNILENQRK
jgi:hypothetical protein